MDIIPQTVTDSTGAKFSTEGWSQNKYVKFTENKAKGTPWLTDAQYDAKPKAPNPGPKAPVMANKAPMMSPR